MRIYAITLAQLAVLWVYGLLAFATIFLYASGGYSGYSEPSGFDISLWFLIPFALVFYTLGWVRHRKS